MTQLTEHFSLSEMTATRIGVPNVPGDKEIQALTNLCTKVLEPLRTIVKLPIKVNSGYRSPTVNAAIGGAKGSQHMSGEAADVVIEGLTPQAITALIVQGIPEFDQVIWEPTWVHISYREGRNRKEILRKVDTGYLLLSDHLDVLGL